MIYEFFSFYNEFDMLELKLQEHDPYVDRFVITEANKTYNQIDKPYRLESQWARYKKWHHKITYLKFDASGLESGWPTEHAQREWPITQFNLKSEDLIVISDLDEFLLPQDWEWIASNIHNVTREILFEMQCYWCYANIKHRAPQKATAVVLNKNYVNTLTHRRPQKVFADKTNPLIDTTIRRSGIHLTWMGDRETFLQKLDGSIEGYNWSKDSPKKDMWEKKKANSLFHWKAKFKRTKLEFAPIESNIYFTESMKSYILKHPEWIQPLDNLS